MVQFDLGSVRTTIVAMRGTRASMETAAVVAADAAGTVILRVLQANVSLRDHSPRDLAAMDHPYARRHGSIRVHTGSSQYLVDSATAVHSQSGRLLRATYKRTSRTKDGPSVRVGIQRTGYTTHVIKGTRVMLPRHVVENTFNAPGTQRDAVKAVVDVMGRVLRTKATVRFERIG